MDFIQFKDFVVVDVDTLDKEELKHGSILFVAGSQPIPESKEDPYLLRIKLVVCPVKDGHIVNNKFFLIDPRSVSKVTEFTQVELTKIMEEDFKQDTPKEG